MQYWMAVDLGTSFIKAGIYDTQGKRISLAQEAVRAERVCKNSFIQRGEMLLSKVITCMRESLRAAADRAGRIEAVAFTGQMAGFIGVDEDWNDITAWSCSLDTRYLPWADKMTEFYNGRAGELSGTCAPLMAPKIRWFEQTFPEEAGRISKYMMLSSYILGRLGECEIGEAVIDASLIGWTGLADIHKKAWSAEICDRLAVDPGHLPDIVSSDAVCGHLSGKMAEKTGLLRGTPLIIGAGDKVAGCIGAGITEPGAMIFEAASYGGFSCLVKKYRRNYRCNYYDVICSENNFLAHKYIPGSGMTLDWFLKQFTKNGSYAEIEEKASRLEIGCQGVMAIGLLGGSAMPFDSQLKGMWMGFDWSSRTEHFYRALLESYTYDLALTIDSVEEAYPEISSELLVMTGGGAKSALWAQMIADVTGKTVCRKRENDAPLRGAVILAQKGMGMKTCAWEKERTGPQEQVEHFPDERRREAYLPYKKRYETYRDRLHTYFADL